MENIKLTTAQKRIIALIAERPGLTFMHTHAWAKRGSLSDPGYYSIHDNNDGLFETRTSIAAVDGLIDAGLIPLSILASSHLRGMHLPRSERPIELQRLAGFIDASSDYLDMTQAAIRASIDRGDLGWDEDGWLNSRCRQCGNVGGYGGCRHC